MNIRTLTFHALIRELEWLYEVIDSHVHQLGWVLSAHDLHIPRLPKRSGEAVLPHYLGAQIKAVFDFAKGEREVTSDFVADVQRAVLELLGGSPVALVDPAMRDAAVWAVLKDRALGVILRAAVGRAKLRDDRWLTLDEISALTGLSVSRAQRLGVESETVDGELRFSPEGVREVLKRFEGSAGK